MAKTKRKVWIRKCDLLGKGFVVERVYNTTQVLPKENVTKSQIEKMIDNGIEVVIK